MMNRDVMEAHLVILGWWPVKFKPYPKYKGFIYGVRNERQMCGERYGRTSVDYLIGSEVFTDIEWWLITDDVLRKITATVDGEVEGWSGCD